MNDIAHTSIMKRPKISDPEQRGLLKCLMEDDKPNCNCKLNHCLKKGW